MEASNLKFPYFQVLTGFLMMCGGIYLLASLSIKNNYTTKSKPEIDTVVTTINSVSDTTFIYKFK